MNNKIQNDRNHLPVLAIDGTAASGKGTLARNLAQSFQFAYLDTGKLYRFLGYEIYKRNADPADEKQSESYLETLLPLINAENLANPVLNSHEAGNAASLVSQHPCIRKALIDMQRDFAKNPPKLGDTPAKGAILDGRDIGTVICPQADLKLYITAKIEIRAKRRYKELHSLDNSVTYDAVLKDMQDRDLRDSTRANAPLKPAEDAVFLDTSEMDIKTVEEKAISLIKDRLGVVPLKP